MMAVEVLKYPILIFETAKVRSFRRLWRRILYGGEPSLLRSKCCLVGGGDVGSGGGRGANAVGGAADAFGGQCP